mmetsp:Transcript_19613/g.47903  ORF Transcript_19613/g.47903 Transcript_19613/m.47903 type:complete len:292 (-) Transcript_19613:308-1183(-)
MEPSSNPFLSQNSDSMAAVGAGSGAHLSAGPPPPGLNPVLIRIRILLITIIAIAAAVATVIISTARDRDAHFLGGELDTDGVFVVLEKAHLRYAKIGTQLSLLNAQDHADYLEKHQEDPELYRPDIVHQALLAVLDSPLNKAGKIKGVYVHTTDGHIIYVDPGTRLPRMFKRFCGVIVEVMQRMRVRSTRGKKLLKLVRSPLGSHLPIGSKKIAFSYSVKNVTDFNEYAKKLSVNEPLVLAVGAMAHGHILDETAEYMEQNTALCISNYPLSAACAISRILGSLEKVQGII